MAKPPVREERLARGLWWDAAWTLVHGCSPVSMACTHCWSAQGSHMRASNPHPKVAARHAGLTEVGPEGPRFNGTVRPDHEALDKPRRRRRPTVYAIWNDLYHPAVPADFIHRAYRIMWECPQHTFIVCTKRPERIHQTLYYGEGGRRPPFARGAVMANVWHLTTVEDQATTRRIRLLLRLRQFGPWPVLGISAEPLLGPLDLPPYLDWVIVGGESGPRARAMKPAWVRDLRDQATAAGVPFFFKSWGKYVPAPPRRADGLERHRRLRPWFDGPAMIRACHEDPAARYRLDGQLWHQFPEAAFDQGAADGQP